MSGVLKIQVMTLDGSGAKVPVTDAEVVVGRRDLIADSAWPHDDLLPTQVHTSGGFYGTWVGDPEAEPTAGEWLLVVRKAGFSPVVQRLTLRDTAGVLQALAGWGPDRDKLDAQAATVSIANAGDRNAAEAPQHTTVNVLLFERVELVAITGFDGGGTNYANMANGRRNLLWKRRRVNDGVIATLFDVLTRRVTVSVKSASKQAKGWVTVFERGLEPPGRALSILDFYEHLHRVGEANPNTVLEAGIFSHAWLMGPIIENTFDHTSSVTERHPDDTDGRQKDWLPPGEESITPTGSVTEGPTMDRFSGLRQAFHAEGAFRIWGCNHMQNVVAECQGANTLRRRGGARDEFFLVSLKTTNGGNFFQGGEENTTLDHVKHSIGSLIQGRYYSRSLEPYDLRGAVTYAGAAARFLGIPVFAGAPGLGSLLGRVEGEPTFFIHSGNREQAGPSASTMSDPPVVYRREAGHPGTESNPVFAWFREEYPSIELDELRFANFTAMLTEALPDPGFHTQRYAMFYDEDQRDRTTGLPPAVVLRLPTGLEVHAPVTGATQPNRIFSRPVPDTLSGVQGHRYVIRRRAIERVEYRAHATVAMLGRTDVTFDSAVFVGVDGRVTWLQVPAGGSEFAPHTEPIQHGEASFLRGLVWEPPTSFFPDPIIDGLIEIGEARHHW